MEVDGSKYAKMATRTSQDGRAQARKPESEQVHLKPIVTEESLHWNGLLHKVAREQNRRSFQELFEHFAPLIKAFAYKVPSISQTEAFADELVQETMLKVWVKADSFDASRASASTWIFTIARNTRIDLLRKYSRHHTNAVSTESIADMLETQDIWFEELENDVFNNLAQQRNKKVIHDSLKVLPDEQSYILEKVYLEDKSHSEVASELALPLGTVKSRVRLALKKLRITIDR